MKQLLALCTVIVAMFVIVPAAHAGPKHHAAMLAYLQANDLTLESARHQPAKLYTKGGFTCQTSTYHTISHCVEDHLVAQEAQAKAVPVAATKSNVTAARTTAQAPTKAVQPATVKTERAAVQKEKKPRKHFVSDSMKVILFWPVVIIAFVLAAIAVVAFLRRRR